RRSRGRRGAAPDACQSGPQCPWPDAPVPWRLRTSRSTPQLAVGLRERSVAANCRSIHDRLSAGSADSVPSLARAEIIERSGIWVNSKPFVLWRFFGWPTILSLQFLVWRQGGRDGSSVKACARPAQPD